LWASGSTACARYFFGQEAGWVYALQIGFAGSGIARGFVFEKRLFDKPRLELELQAAFVGALLLGRVARGGVGSDGQMLDPVLAAHLGLASMAG
jgi:hypothetical protein